MRSGARITARYGPFTVFQASNLEIWRMGLGGPPRPPRVAWGVPGEPGGTTTKKNKKKIRHPGLESGESAWKAEVLPLHQWRLFSRAAPMGAQRSIGENPLNRGISTILRKKPHGFLSPPARVHATHRAFFIVYYFNSNGNDRLLAADCNLRTSAAAQFQKLKRALAVSRATCDDQ